MSQSLQSESVDKIIPALIKARASIDHARMDAKNPFFKSTYASLESVIDATTAALLAESLVVAQATVTLDTIPHVATTLFHSSGQWIRSFTQVLYSEAANAAQAQGAGLTYARRYGLAALLNIGQEDDDANSAGSRPQPPRPASAPSKVSPPKKVVVSPSIDPASPHSPHSIKKTPTAHPLLGVEPGDYRIKKANKEWEGLTISEVVNGSERFKGIGLPHFQKSVNWWANESGRKGWTEIQHLKECADMFAEQLQSNHEEAASDWQNEEFDTALDVALAKNGGK